VNVRRATGSRAIGLAVSLSFLGAAYATDVRASSEDDAIADAQRGVAEASQGVPTVERSIANAKVDDRSPQARIADADMLFRSGDYTRAASVLSQVIEKYPNHPTAIPDATFLLGESYYASKQYLSARRIYRRIVDNPQGQRFSQYQPRALTRLVDIAIRLQDNSTLDAIFAKMSQVPAAGAEGELAYARGKGLFAKQDYAGARAVLANVATKDAHFYQARYLLGVMAMKEAAAAPSTDKAKAAENARAAAARYATAIETFRQITRLPADTPEHRQVVDLAWLAIGRLSYETDQLVAASEAYGHVERGSSEFNAMLYELSWVHVRTGDADRAMRSLEVLSVADPNGPHVADATLLRADLLLRTGQFEKALALYQSARAQFDPMRERVETFIGSTSDPGVFYEKLVTDNGDGIDATDSVPALAVTWAREAGNGPAAFAVIDGVKECRSLLKQTNSFVERLSAALAATNRVRAFPELKIGEEKALSLLNAVTMARKRIADGLDKVEDPGASGDIQRVRDQRRTLQQRLQYLPITDGDFAARDNQAQKQWNGVSQHLQQLTLQIDQLQAVVNGLRRMLREAPTRGVVRDAATTQMLEAELAQSEKELSTHKLRVADLRKTIEISRAQVGFGDQRFVEDADVRAAYRRALGDEVKLAAAGSGGPGAIAYAQRVATVLVQADATDAQLEAIYRDIEGRVARRAEELKATLAGEVANLNGYAGALEALDSESRLVVGQVAMRNFEIVRDRFRNIVLRADVGVTEEAWELREEQQTRVRNLQLERSRSEQQLNEELREVLDDVGETDKSSGSPK
jgi:tetratricopeptide (TPR) repeat protein